MEESPELEPHPEHLTELADDGELSWFNIVTRNGMKVTSVHQVPRETFTHEATIWGDCPCGPWRVDGPTLFFKHWPLEADYENDPTI